MVKEEEVGSRKTEREQSAPGSKNRSRRLCFSTCKCTNDNGAKYFSWPLIAEFVFIAYLSA